MRFLYLDIDTLRPDHLGCYGYHRSTSPNIDALAERSAVFENVHASDVPCLPSRTALLTGRFGIHNGVVNHGGTDADPVFDGEGREFWSSLQLNSLPTNLKGRGGRQGGARMRTVSISSFAQRHSAFHWYAGFDEAYNVGKFGLESADEVYAIADDWLRRKGGEDDWFLHVHMCICGTPIPPIGRLLRWANPLPIARCQRGTQRMSGLVTGSLAAPIARAKTMGLRLIGRCYRCIRVSPRRRQICWLREKCLMATIVGYWLLMTMLGGF